MTYKRFAAMIITSTVVMFGLMYSTAYAFDHVWWSQTRFWMALYMGAAMAVIMHPAAAGGGPEASSILGKAFLQHGTTENVPVGLDAAVAPGTTLYAMLHDDTSEIGAFECGGAGSLDPPLMQNGAPVTTTFVAR